jgi:hypothetical protein
MSFDPKSDLETGFSVRRGGERGIDDDDVEGHAMTAGVDRKESTMSDQMKPDEIGRRAAVREDGTADDVEGHSASRPAVRATDDEDDVEGHTSKVR